MKKERAISVSLTNGAECICDPDIVLGDKYGLWDINNEISPRGTLLDLNVAWELFISKQRFSSYTFEQQEDSEHERITYILVDQDKNPVGPEFTVETDNGEILVPITETITSLTAEKGKYYRLDAPVETLAVTLPAMDAVTSVKKVGIYFTAGTTPDVTITAADNKRVVFQNGYKIETGKTYKINALFDGSAWVVTAVEIFIPEPMNIITYEATAKLAEVTDNYDGGLHTNAFWGKSGRLTITSHTFENGIGTIEFDSDVTYISSNAFYGCSGLTSVTIPDSVTSIGESVFKGCTLLPVVDNIRYADTYAVEAVDKTLTTYTLKEDTRFIGTDAFRGCTSLTSIDIPDSVTSIGNDAFYECSGLTSITIPNGVTSIGKWAFANCYGITSIVIPDSVTTLDDAAFQGCSGLTSVTIGSGVTYIDVSTFNSCSSLTSVTIPDNVTRIASGAFANCNLTSIISLATTAPTIQSDTFRNVEKGGTLTVPVGSTGYDEWMDTRDCYLGYYNWTKVEQ